MSPHRAAISAIALFFTVSPVSASALALSPSEPAPKADSKPASKAEPAPKANSKAVPKAEAVTVVGTKLVRTLPRAVSIEQLGMCFDSHGGIPNADEEGHVLQLWYCGDTPAQSFTLEDGVLYVGYDRNLQVVPDIRHDWKGCNERWQDSKQRTYRLAVCNDNGPTGLTANFYDPGHTVLGSNTPASGDVIAAGRPLIVAPITAANPARALWSYAPDSATIRVDGTNLCITPVFGDRTYGAPLVLDDCDQPMMSASGAAGPTDGRAATRLETHTPQGRRYYLPK